MPLISPLVSVDVALQDYTKYAVGPIHVIALELICGAGVGEPG